MKGINTADRKVEGINLAHPSAFVFSPSTFLLIMIKTITASVFSLLFLTCTAQVSGKYMFVATDNHAAIYKNGYPTPIGTVDNWHSMLVMPNIKVGTTSRSRLRTIELNMG